MWRRSIRILLITWVVACTVLIFVKETNAQVVVEDTKTPAEGSTMARDTVQYAAIKTLPANMIPAIADLYDQRSDSEAESRSVQWAGTGDISKNLQLPPLLQTFPKRVSESQSKKNTHWDIIKQALNVLQNENLQLKTLQNSKTTSLLNVSLPSLTKSYNNWLPTNATFLAMLLYNDTKQIQDSTNRYNSPHITLKTDSRKDFTFNPLEVFLPDHVRHSLSHEDESQSQNEGNHHLRSESTSDSIINIQKPPDYIPWPSIGQGTIPNQTLNITSQPRQKLLPNQNNDTLQIYQNSMRMTNPLMSYSSLLNQQYKQWPQLTHTQSHQLQLKNTNTEDSFISEYKPLVSSFDNFGQNGQTRNNSLKSNISVTISPKKIDRYSRMTETSDLPQEAVPSQSQEIMNNKKLPWEDKSRITNNQNPKEKMQGEIYTQPWHHAIVQNDLKNWGFPYDEATLKDLPPGHAYSSQTLPGEQHKKNYNLNINPPKVNDQTQVHKALSPKIKAHHLAIVEASQNPTNQPLLIKNVHVIAPKPDNIPPSPLFRPVERKPLEFSPYVIHSELARISGDDGNYPVLMIPYPVQETDLQDRNSNLYPVMIPLKKVSRRQDNFPLNMFMRPIRDIFRIRSFPKNVHERRPLPQQQNARTPNLAQPNLITQQQEQHDTPLTQLVPPPELKQSPQSQSDSLLAIQFPGFGPPKGEDIVIMLDDSDDQKNNLQELQQHPTQLFNPLTSGAIQAQSTVSTTSQLQSLDTPDVDVTNGSEQDAIISVDPIAVFRQEAQNAPVSFQPLKQSPFQPGNLASPPATFEKFQQLQPLEEASSQTGNSNNNAQPATPVTPTFIRWPNTQNTNTAGLSAPLGTFSNSLPLTQTSIFPQGSLSFFNRPSVLQPFRLPSFPNMNSFNPFSMFRSRENTQGTNTHFSLLPSFSRPDNEPSVSMPKTNKKNPITSNNLNPQNTQQSNFATNYGSKNNSSTEILRDTRSVNLGKGTFNFMPHLQPILYDEMKPPPLQNKSTVIHSPEIQQFAQQQQNQLTKKPGIQPLINIHQSSLTDQNQNQQQSDIRINPKLQKEPNHSFGSFQESHVQNFSSTTLENSQQNIHAKPIFSYHQSYPRVQGYQITKVNPQSNPARPISTESIPRQEIFGPDLIRFTIDDVVFPPPLSIQSDQPKVSKVTEIRRASHRFFDENDMDVSPTEEIVTIAKFVQPPNSSKPPTVTLKRITPTPSTINIVQASTQITQLPESHMKNTIFKIRTTPVIPLTKQPNIQANLSATLFNNALPKNNLSHSASNIPTTYRPPINHKFKIINNVPFFSMERGTIQPEATDTNTSTPVKETKNNEIGVLSSASSSWFTITEATPMPKSGENFQTITQFQTFTSQAPSPALHKPVIPPPRPSTTTIRNHKLEVLETESIKQNDAEFSSMAKHATRSQPPGFMKIRKRPEIMMPGRWNYRTIIKPPQIESDSVPNSDTKVNSKEPHIEHNQFKVQFNIPSRKVIHMNRPTPKPALITEKFTVISTLPTTTTTSETRNQPFIIPSPSEVDINMNFPITTSRTEIQEIKSVLFPTRRASHVESKKENEEKDEIETYTTTPIHLHSTTVSTTTADETTTAFRKTPIYNSIQRLRNMMANKRKNLSQTTPANVILSTESVQIKQAEKFMTNISTTITPRKYGMTPRTSTPSSTVGKSMKLSASRANFRSFSAYKTHPVNRELTSSTMAALHHPIKTTKEPMQITTLTPRSTVVLKLEKIDNENEGSGSSSPEWYQPIQEKFLIDHPEMINFYKWESSHVDTSDENDDSGHHDVQNYSQGETEMILAEASNVFPVTVKSFWQPFKADESSKSRHPEGPPGGQLVLTSNYTSIARSTPSKIHEVTTSDYSNNSWTPLKKSEGQGENPHSHILYST